MQKITPFLWFDDKAEEAARFYASFFKVWPLLAADIATLQQAYNGESA